MTVVRCANCMTALQGKQDGSQHQPCDVCGHTERLYEKTVTGTVGTRSSIALKAKSPGERKPFMEQKSGDDLHRKTGKWSKLTRVIDRRGDRYVEKIVDEETGEILADVDEPLSEHRGHGSAKPTK